MARQNLESSLGAVESALSVLAGSLEQAGFAAGADAYRQMADVIIGQRLWAEENDITDYDARYVEVGRLATRIFQCLSPYADVAVRLSALTGLAGAADDRGDRADELAEVDEQAGLDIESEADSSPGEDLSQAILAVLRSTDEALAATRIGAEVQASTSTVRQELAALTERGLVEVAKAGGRSLFRAA